MMQAEIYFLLILWLNPNMQKIIYKEVLQTSFWVSDLLLDYEFI